MKPRQRLPKIYIRSGSIYASKRHVITKNKSLLSSQAIEDRNCEKDEFSKFDSPFRPFLIPLWQCLIEEK